MVWINGRAVEAEGKSLGEMVEAVCRQQGVNPEAVVVLLNEEIWSKGRWPDRTLVAGDVVEIVTLMQGG
ncbi:sulfur carrier protein ThiS [Meiothermus ruber]|jgi:sulfur carrier protein|uniref:Thiamine biosynthesis protein ThiS n=1 Tax=Meiothermus ruber (strain ATCC 35948 / DSM 1279 / VKM B-1258 / 21) TaxID=504728 RepID=D3PTL4_MEIRD|nr:sulfur carrier protein ThiS [Meiothermus ruber]ADD28797.1 thiamine biosynthesis protein ThiS [Meiothermus ruber DSM 1279]AGK05754.1 thiamine biosynthesis protein ThiS [Meiothermus ruber DSM 1279]MCL6529450.1 sulfur carrier protein ThiS [Meiothermus ruber]MCX7801506.1 sulfur carrier protein ThiS [Meiothermus ruber]GAO75708.1 thiamine biosynthesis protein ThiS [Meiothermus ruber H328]